MPITQVGWTVPTRVGSVIINGLKAPSQYINKFIVEVYADSALTDLVASKTSAASWDGTNSVQTGPLVFSGLPVTSTYWLRAGTGSSHSPLISWSAAYQADLAEVSALESITYGGIYTSTSSGVSYQVRPSGAPANLDHYEALYTVDYSVSPLSTDTPTWKGKVNASGLLTIGAVAAPGQTVQLWMRGVDTAFNYQPWTLVSTLMVTASGLGSLDALPDGITYGRTLASGLTGGVPDPRKSNGLLKLGSLNPAWSGSLYWSATASSSSVGSVSFWWDQMIVKRIDGTQTVIGSRSSNTPLIVTGLTPSTSGNTVVYDFYPYIDDFANVITFLSNGDSGSPTYAWLDANITENSATSNTQLMNRQDRLGLGPVQISMPIYVSGGTTSGGGGGYGGTCPRADMKVRLACGTVIRADEIKPGDKLVTTLEYGVLVKVIDVKHEQCSEWIEIHTTKGSVIVHPETHFPVEDSHECVKACDLTLSHLLKSRHGTARITDIRLSLGEHTRVILTCDRSKVFLCGVNAPELVIHNLRLLPC